MIDGLELCNRHKKLDRNRTLLTRMLDKMYGCIIWNNHYFLAFHVFAQVSVFFSALLLTSFTHVGIIMPVNGASVFASCSNKPAQIHGTNNCCCLFGSFLQTKLYTIVVYTVSAIQYSCLYSLQISVHLSINSIQP